MMRSPLALTLKTQAKLNSIIIASNHSVDELGWTPLAPLHCFLSGRGYFLYQLSKILSE